MNAPQCCVMRTLLACWSTEFMWCHNCCYSCTQNFPTCLSIGDKANLCAIWYRYLYIASQNSRHAVIPHSGRLFDCFSSRNRGLDPGIFHVRLTVDQVVLEQVFLHALRFTSQYHFTNAPYLFLQRSCLRHCATSRKVAGSISDGGYCGFSLNYSFVGRPSLLAEMSTMDIFWG